MAEISVFTYVLLLSLILIYFLIRYRELNVVVLVISLYLVSSFGSLYYYYNNLWEDYRFLTLAPFLYIVLCLLITVYPLFRYCNVGSKVLRINILSKNLLVYTAFFFTIISILPFIEILLHLPKVIGNHSALAQSYESRVNGIEVQSYLSWLSRKLYWVNFLLRDIAMIVFFYQLLIEKVNWWLVLGVFISVVNPILFAFSIGGRSAIINSVFCFIFTYVLFREYLPRKRVKNMDVVLTSFLLGILVIISTLTIARFNSNSVDDIWTWVSLYVGEGPLNFSNNLWPVSITANGDNTFLVLRYIFGLTDNYDIESVRSTRDVLGVNNLVFYTYIGTIYYDFNKVGTLLFILLLTVLCVSVTKSKTKYFTISKLFFLMLLGRMLMIGTMFYPYTLWPDQWSLIYAIIFCFLLRYLENQKKEKFFF